MDQVLIMDPSLVYRPDISDEEKKFLGLTDLSPDMDFTPGKEEAEFRRFDVSISCKVNISSCPGNNMQQTH